MSDYTPTTDAVRINYASSMFAHNSAHEPYAAFNRWLKQHDRDVAAKALEEAANDLARDLSNGPNPKSGYATAGRDLLTALRARAQAIRNGEINP